MALMFRRILPTFCFTKRVVHFYKFRINKKLQWRAPYRYHSAKCLVKFWSLFPLLLTTFWWLPFKLANQSNCKDCGRRRCPNCPKANVELDNSASWWRNLPSDRSILQCFQTIRIPQLILTFYSFIPTQPWNTTPYFRPSFNVTPSLSHSVIVQYFGNSSVLGECHMTDT